MTESTKQTYVSPPGKLLWMAVNTPVKNEYNDKLHYSVRVEYDTKQPGVTEFRNSLLSINKKLIGPGEDSKYKCPAGCFTVNYKSIFKPKITDDEGTEVNEELPRFTQNSTGTVMVSYTTFGGKKGGGVTLTGVGILEFNPGEEPERKEAQATVSLREALANVKKS